MEDSFKIIRLGVKTWIEDNEFEYSYMESFGLTPIQIPNLKYYIENAILLITDNQYKLWCSHKADVIMNSVLNFIYTCIDTGIWREMYLKFENKKEMSNFIFELITKQMELISP